MKTVEVLIRMTITVSDKTNVNDLMVDTNGFGSLIILEDGGLRKVRYHVQGETIQSVKEIS